MGANERKNKIRQRLWKIRAKKVVIATGSIERPLIFNNNDRPGILLSSSIKKYIYFFGVKSGNEISLFTNNDSAYETAISLNKSGVKVNTIIDIRENSTSSLVKNSKDWYKYFMGPYYSQYQWIQKNKIYKCSEIISEW